MLFDRILADTKPGCRLGVACTVQTHIDEHPAALCGQRINGRQQSRQCLARSGNLFRPGFIADKRLDLIQPGQAYLSVRTKMIDGQVTGNGQQHGARIAQFGARFAPKQSHKGFVRKLRRRLHAMDPRAEITPHSVIVLKVKQRNGRGGLHGMGKQ